MAAPLPSDFVLARRLATLGPRPDLPGWHEVLDGLHARVPLSRAALRVLADVRCPAETRRIDLVALLRADGGPVAEARLRRLLGDPAPAVVAAAVRALAAVGGTEALVALARLPGTERARARIRARLGAGPGALSLPPDDAGRLSDPEDPP